jgi:hypothetical protein
MKKHIGLLMTLAALGLPTQAQADMELKTPDGRSVLLKDDGTWRYRDAPDAKGNGGDKPASTELARLQLDALTRFGPNCRVTFTMTNKLPYEIIQLVPYFSAFRAGGALHESLGVGFQNVRPASSRTRTVDFNGIVCEDIARIQVVGGDRCEMGELSKFTPDKGVCLARVQVAPSQLLTFEK